MEYILLAILWCLWCTVHSAMISMTVTDYLKERLKDKYRFYRIFYNIIAIATLVPLVRFGSELKGQVLFRWDGSLQIVQLVLAATGFLLFVSGAMKYDMLQFIGVRQIKTGKSHSALSDAGDIDTSGILGVIRHPWYSAVIILIWVGYRDMYVSTLIVNIILTGYILIGTVLEERKLIVEYGDRYREYKKRVSMLFPFKWILSKVSKEAVHHNEKEN